MFTLDINTTPLKVGGFYDPERCYKLKYINSISPDFHIYEIVRDWASDKKTLSFRFMVKTEEIIASAKKYVETLDKEE